MVGQRNGANSGDGIFREAEEGDRGAPGGEEREGPTRDPEPQTRENPGETLRYPLLPSPITEREEEEPPPRDPPTGEERQEEAPPT